MSALLRVVAMVAAVSLAAPAPVSAAARPQHEADPASSASVRPVDGAVVRRFDPPAHRFAAGHRGVDLAATGGQVVRSVRAGTVRWAGAVAGTGYVTVDHGGGLTTTYGDVEPLLAVGARITAGTPVAAVKDGRSHLDWGARWDHGGRRHYLDPLLLLERLRPVLVAPGPEESAALRPRRVD